MCSAQKVIPHRDRDKVCKQHHVIAQFLPSTKLINGYPSTVPIFKQYNIMLTGCFCPSLCGHAESRGPIKTMLLSNPSGSRTRQRDRFGI
ncbi:hypothetical protein FRX31_006869 [Thalictrum thalictroides]|uniref:Uncharacterized protein n=1 Tax=Thalictrum thalictroides TaxID=46969 RepID=A0A7J6X1J5_THATH|nr:hypothetical protein FRX31_006869 [Thalictrum thalictroides]